MSVELIRRGQSQVYGQVGVSVRGRTWVNLAGDGDTSPQTVENLDSAKTYLLINSEGANVEIDTVDTPTPIKLTGETSFDFVWSSGKIALYELSAEETALDASVLGQKYHYVSGTKSTNSVRVKSVGKNLFDKHNKEQWIFNSTPGTFVTHEGINALRVLRYFRENWIPFRGEKNTQYTVRVNMKEPNGLNIMGISFSYSDGTTIDKTVPTTPTFGNITATSQANKTLVKIGFGSAGNREVFVDLDSLQIEKGTTATTYEPYKESIVNVNLPEPLRSLPNGVKDEVNIVNGKRTQRVSEEGEELATPITTYVEPQPLQIFPNGNRWVEFANKEVAIYNTGIHVANTNLPIKEMIKVDKIGLQNGRWYRESVDLAGVTVAGDGLSFTIDGATSGPFEQYEFVYYYDSALSTLPELVIPDEPSLVTIKNMNISL